MKPGPKPARPEPISIEMDGEPCLKIALTKGMWAIIDARDAAQVLPYFWHAKQHGSQTAPLWYAARLLRKGENQFGTRRTIKLHQALLGVGPDIDHRNGDGLDNRRSNLRPATESQNQGNSRLRADSSSGFKGVMFKKPRGNRRGAWCARIGDKGKRRHLGYFGNPQDAARAYNVAAVERWGEFAKLNIIPEQTQTEGNPCI